MAISLENLTYRVVSRNSANDFENNLYKRAYQFWKKIFTATFKEVISSNYVLYSDEFLLQDQIGVLFSGKEIVGIISYSKIKTSSLVDMDRSYFKNYPNESIEYIKRNFNEVFIISNLAVSPKNRKSISGTSYSSYLIGLGVKEFLHSDCDTLITITRNDRKTHNSVGIFGGKTLSFHNVHNINSNVMSINKEDGRNSFFKLELELQESIFELFENNRKINFLEKNLSKFSLLKGEDQMIREQIAKEAHETVDIAFQNYKHINFENKKTYEEWLAQTYYYVHHVTRILAFAAAKCDLYQEEELHFRLIDHLNEEKDHDKMLLSDMNNIGMDLKDHPEKLETRNFYQSLFYMIETYGPYSLLGYFMPQEGLACLKLPALYKELSKQYGEESCTFLKEHCELDVEHFGDALEYLKTVPGNKLNAVRAGMFRSAELYSEIMSAISKEVYINESDKYWNQIKTPFLEKSAIQSH